MGIDIDKLKPKRKYTKKPLTDEEKKKKHVKKYLKKLRAKTKRDKKRKIELGLPLRKKREKKRGPKKEPSPKLFELVILKDGKFKRRLKSYSTLMGGKKYFDGLVEKSKRVLFPKLINASERAYYSIVLIEPSIKKQQETTVSYRDDLGRNRVITLPGYKIIYYSEYNMEEDIIFKNKETKVHANFIIKLLSNDNDFKQVFLIHNKLIIEVNQKYFIFTVKNVDESNRLLDVIRRECFATKVKNIFFFSDVADSLKSEIFDDIEKQIGVTRTYIYKLTHF